MVKQAAEEMASLAADLRNQKQVEADCASGVSNQAFELTSGGASAVASGEASE